MSKGSRNRTKLHRRYREEIDRIFKRKNELTLEESARLGKGTCRLCGKERHGDGYVCEDCAEKTRMAVLDEHGHTELPAPED